MRMYYEGYEVEGSVDEIKELLSNKQQEPVPQRKKYVMIAKHKRALKKGIIKSYWKRRNKK